ncbi:MAG: FAD-dependent oxidoreductase, partial [Rariglobus sp.]
DIGNKAAIGGLAREFYRRLGKHYGVDEAWTFEPSVAHRVFTELVKESGVPVHCRQFLASVTMNGGRIESLTTESGLTVQAQVFIDASYEGDLLAKAGVSHHIGREDNATYGETLNGAQVREKHQFDFPVSPYVVEGDPASGLLPGIETGEQPVIGRGDHRVQAYNFRMCMTDDPANRIAFPKPAHYDRSRYELLARYLKAGWRQMFNKFDRLRVRTKTDTNNHGAVSSDFIGENHGWAAAGYAERERLFQAHVNYQQGLYWFYQNDPAVPPDIREAYAKWGLCKDEFTETGGWPHQLYVREARRMISDYVMTEHECVGARLAPEPVGLAAYSMDSHNCRRFVDANGHVRNDGDVQVHGFTPYPISYRSIVPRESECTNLIVPVCLAASHIAYGSIRMEPVFMSLGQVAAIAAEQVIRAGTSVQGVAYETLAGRLGEAGVVIAWNKEVPVSGADMHAWEA